MSETYQQKKFFVCDGVFENHRTIYDWVRLQAEFSDQENPIDGTIYPDICTNVPSFIVEKLGGMVANLIEGDAKVNFAFFRRSMAGVPVPNLVHSDLDMGEISVMYYVTPSEFVPPGSGTAFMQHKETGLHWHPKNETELQTLTQDTNDLSKWDQSAICAGYGNRVAVFDAGLLHLAQPVGGFGDTPDNARVVMTMFMDRA